MKTETSQCSSLPNPQHQVGSNIGCFVTLNTDCGSRFEGVLYHLSLQDRTVGLQNVTCYGADGIQFDPSDGVAEHMLFSRFQIKTLFVKPSSTPSGGLPQHQVGSNIGCFVTLNTDCGSRFEGVLYHLSLQDRTVGLQNVTCYGADGIQFDPSDGVAEHMLFSRFQIKTLFVKPSSTPSGGLPKGEKTDQKVPLMSRDDFFCNFPPVPLSLPRVHHSRFGYPSSGPTERPFDYSEEIHNYIQLNPLL